MKTWLNVNSFVCEIHGQICTLLLVSIDWCYHMLSLSPVTFVIFYCCCYVLHCVSWRMYAWRDGIGQFNKNWVSVQQNVCVVLFKLAEWCYLYIKCGFETSVVDRRRTVRSAVAEKSCNMLRDFMRFSVWRLMTMICDIVVIVVLVCNAADTRQTNVGQHVFANNVGKQKSVVCSKSWLTFFVGQQVANGALWLVGCSKHHDAEWTDASYIDYTNYTSPFYLYIIHECTQTDFGRLRFRLRAITEITAAATSSAESAFSAILLSNICWPTFVCRVTQMLANKCCRVSAA